MIIVFQLSGFYYREVSLRALPGSIYMGSCTYEAFGFRVYRVLGVWVSV